MAATMQCPGSPGTTWMLVLFARSTVCADTGVGETTLSTQADIWVIISESGTHVRVHRCPCMALILDVEPLG